jgi:hypothetical protein
MTIKNLKRQRMFGKTFHIDSQENIYQWGLCPNRLMPQQKEVFYRETRGLKSLSIVRLENQAHILANK